MSWLEYFGYGASIIIAISITMNNIKKLRMINLVGASCFSIYGLLIGAYPVFLLNGFIALINIYNLYQIYHKKDYFTINDTLNQTSFFICKFLEFWGSDIKKFFPEFDINKISKPNIIVISRNLNPVGLFIYEVINSKTIQIHLDYATPQYRDLKNVRYLFTTKGEDLKRLGYENYHVENSCIHHQKYLQKLGFTKDPINSNIFTKQIS